LWQAAEGCCRGTSVKAMDAKVILCDFAEVSGGKLFISGAGLSLVGSATQAPPYRANLTLAVIGLIRPEDTDVQHKMTMELVQLGELGETRVPLVDELPEGADPADKGMFIIYFVAPRSADMLPTDEWAMPMAVPMFGLALPELGPYYFSVRVDGREMDRASFRLVVPQMEPPQPPPGAGLGPAGRPVVPGPAL
jgi:hypothetical protein